MKYLLLLLFLSACGGGGSDPQPDAFIQDECIQFSSIEEYFKSGMVCRVILIGERRHVNMSFVPIQDGGFIGGE